MTTPAETPLRLAELFNIRFSSRSRLPSAIFFARIQADWSSRKIRPSPVPVFADPALGAGIENLVPRVLNWKFFFKCTCKAGVDELAVGDEIVTEARMRVGFPQDGQNFRDASLQILGRHDSYIRSNKM